MKRLFFLLVGVALFGLCSMSFADSFEDGINAAHKLKAKGDFVGAAEVSPRVLCKAMYYWNAACKVVGHRDSKGDWAINPTISAADKTEGLRLLKLSQDNLDQADSDGLIAGDDGTCSGVNADDLKDLIQKVTDCVNGHCQ